MQSDLLLMGGEGQAAVATLQDALQQWPAHPALLAQLARAQLLQDRAGDAAATLAQGQAPHPELALARGALARRQGDAPSTLAAYTEATQLAPQDARGWLGLGSAHRARGHRPRAPTPAAGACTGTAPGAGPGRTRHAGDLCQPIYRRRKRLPACAADHSADYVALTGLGLLRLARPARKRRSTPFCAQA
jgi:tetratricopeptide (TPR) repeat protein